MRARRERRHLAGVLRQEAFAAGFLVAGLLLFTWPFVRVPRFGLVPAFLHLTAAWALIVTGLWAMSRALAREETEGRGEDEDG
jgi:hypothetical protein